MSAGSDLASDPPATASVKQTKLVTRRSVHFIVFTPNVFVVVISVPSAGMRVALNPTIFVCERKLAEAFEGMTDGRHSNRTALKTFWRCK